jgi:putative oxidoreductase
MRSTSSTKPIRTKLAMRPHPLAGRSRSGTAFDHKRPPNRAASRIAGPLLAGIFVHGGWDSVCRPESKVKVAEPVTRLVSSQFDLLPDDPAVLVRANGVVQVAAGGLLAAGKFQRLAAMALFCSLIPTTYAGHAFWSEADEERAGEQRMHFYKNLGLLGGLLLIASTPRSKRSPRH